MTAKISPGYFAFIYSDKSIITAVKITLVMNAVLSFRYSFESVIFTKNDIGELKFKNTDKHVIRGYK